MASSAADAAARLSFSSSSSATSFCSFSSLSRLLSHCTFPSSESLISAALSSSSLSTSRSNSSVTDLETGFSAPPFDELEWARSTLRRPLFRACIFDPHTAHTTPPTRNACTAESALTTRPSTASQRLPRRHTLAAKKRIEIATSRWWAPTEPARAAAHRAAAAHSPAASSASEAGSTAANPSAEPTRKYTAPAPGAHPGETAASGFKKPAPAMGFLPPIVTRLGAKFGPNFESKRRKDESFGGLCRGSDRFAWN
uniref:Floury1 n=2 Tax=Arundo donax TaxID=35708 RepID=A0A0A9BRH6_ARUDO